MGVVVTKEKEEEGFNVWEEPQHHQRQPSSFPFSPVYTCFTLPILMLHLDMPYPHCHRSRSRNLLVSYFLLTILGHSNV